MITERDIAKKFSSIWLESFPVLSPNFMRVFNESHISYFVGNKFVSITGHSDVVSEYGFYLAKIAFEEKVDLGHQDVLSVSNRAFTSALSSVRNSVRVIDLPETLSDEEQREGVQLANNILSFVSSFHPKEVRFAPKLPGYGIVGECLADISIDDALFEIKTVKRNFRSKDLKQLILYLALGIIAGKENWSYAGLYNPRNGRYSRFSVDGLLGYLSGGRSSIDAFRHLLESMSRDVISEQRF